MYPKGAKPTPFNESMNSTTLLDALTLRDTFQNTSDTDAPEVVETSVAGVNTLLPDVSSLQATHKNILGDHIAMVVVMEYQKRGLPHANAILWNNNRTSPKNPLNVGHIVQLPGPAHPNLYKAFSQYLMNNRWMVHYNLLLKYRRHRNNEEVRGVLVVKYLFKYLFKGEPVTGLLMQ